MYLGLHPHTGFKNDIGYIYRSVAIPELIEACEVKNKIDRRVVRIVIPFCATVNSDGSALFITAATVFIARLSGHSLDATDMCVDV